MAKYKAVLFDLDGTLINTLDDLADAANYMLRHFGYPEFDTEAYKYKVGNGMRRLMERALPEDHRTTADIDAAMDVFMPYYSEHSLDKAKQYDGISDVLQKLRNMGIKTAVITNKAHAAAVKILDNMLPGCFDVIFGQREGVPTKPDPTSANTVISELGVLPNECIFIGDSGVDMQTANNTGAFALGALWGFRTKDELIENGAMAVIEKPAEILKFI